MQFDETLDQRETEPHAGLAQFRNRAPLEPPEDPPLLGLGNADPGIRHGETDEVALARAARVIRPPGGVNFTAFETRL